MIREKKRRARRRRLQCRFRSAGSVGFAGFDTGRKGLELFSHDVVVERGVVVPPVTTMYFMGALVFITRSVCLNFRCASAYRLFRRRALFVVGDTRFSGAFAGATARVEGTRERRLRSSCT